MAVDRVSWVSWATAWSRMPEICDAWCSDNDHRQKAFVNALKLRGVAYDGEAREINSFGFALPLPIEVEIGLRPNPTRLQDVVSGLLKVSFIFGALAEYQRERQSDPLPFGWSQIQIAPRRNLEIAKADVSSAVLAWEEFRDALHRYELPNGAVPNPDPTDPLLADDDHRHDGARARIPLSNRKKRRDYERRVKDFQKRGRTPPVQTTADGQTQGDREWAVERGVSRDEITEWRREILGTQTRGRPRNSPRK